MKVQWSAHFGLINKGCVVECPAGPPGPGPRSSQSGPAGNSSALELVVGFTPITSKSATSTESREHCSEPKSTMDFTPFSL
jgi:hypothetical protein